MKKTQQKIATIIAVILMIGIPLAGCSAKDGEMESRVDELKEEILVLEAQKEVLEQNVVGVKEELGVAKYVITFKIKQTHVTLNIKEHIRDSMNEITLSIPVDKEYYDSVSVGDVITDAFRVGSLVLHGTFGSWQVTVDDKTIM